MKRNVSKLGFGLLAFVFVSSFLFSVPVTAQQTELLFPLFKHSREYNSFWTVLAVKATSFVAVVDHDQLESSNYFVVYAFTSTIANVSVQVDIYDYYEVWTDELGVERLNASQSLEPIVVQSFNQQVHKIELKVPEVKDEFKVMKISMGESSPYFMFEYKTFWDYQTTLWTNIDFFLQVQLVNWAMILFVAFIALGAAILFVSKARCIPPLSMNPMPQFVVTFVGLGLASMGSMVRPPDLFALTIGVFCVVFVGCMQLWNLKAPVKEATVLESEIDKPYTIDLLEDGGTAQYIDRPSWRDTFLRLLGCYFVIEDFHLYKRPTPKDATSEYLVYGAFVKPQVKVTWRGLKPVVGIVPCRIDYYSKTAVRSISVAVVEKLSQEEVKKQLLDVSKALEASVKALASDLEKEPLLFRFPRFRRLLKKIPVIRRLTVYIRPQELIDLQTLREQLIADLALTERRIDEILAEFRQLSEEPYELNEELKILRLSGDRIEQLIRERNKLRRELHTQEKIFLGRELVEWEMAERGLEVETDLPQKEGSERTSTADTIMQEVEEDG